MSHRLSLSLLRYFFPPVRVSTDFVVPVFFQLHGPNTPYFLLPTFLGSKTVPFVAWLIQTKQFIRVPLAVTNLRPSMACPAYNCSRSCLFNCRTDGRENIGFFIYLIGGNKRAFDRAVFLHFHCKRLRLSFSCPLHKGFRRWKVSLFYHRLRIRLHNTT